MPTYTEVIAKRINEICDKKNISINKLSKLAGLTNSSIFSILNGCSNSPNLRTLHKIATGLEMDLIEFLDFPEMRNTEFDDKVKEKM